MSRRVIFYLIVATLAGHLYIGVRLVPPLSAIGGCLLGAWLVGSALMVPSPFLSRALRGKSLPDACSWVAYLMMGVFSSLLVLTFLRDIGLLFAYGISALLPASLAWQGAGHATALLVLALTAAITLAGLFNARRLAKVVPVALPIAGLPDALRGFTIVQISDVHVGPTIKQGYVRAIVERVNALEPDLIAITGDLVDGSVARLRPHVAPLAQLSAKHGSFFVTGNHEYYSGADDWVAEFRRLGLIVLLNEHVVLERGGERILVAGVTDYNAHHHDPQRSSDAARAIAGAPLDVAMRLLLAHQPRSAPQAQKAGFDVQLCGHTHGGQFWPWPLVVSLQQPFTSGLKRWQGLLVYTSRGTGYWGPPIRFGAPSEITRLKLVAA